jgi:cytosolic 5'-nucleotidase 3
MRKEVILDIVQKNTCIFREYAHEIFDLLQENDIPILIFSAGIGNIIEEFLKSKNKLTPNVYILSNTFVFDQDGNATDYKGPIIHVFNKSEAQLTDPKYTKIIKERENVILLGDNIEDLQMAENIDKNLLITIGFLNANIEENIEKYKENFDIVITNDNSMKYVYDVLKEIIQN